MRGEPGLHESVHLAGWRKEKSWKREIKNAMRGCEKIASSGGANKGERLLKSAKSFLDLASRLECKVRGDIAELRS